jgi:FMN phosphatase YigB (HAD superfamily)
MIKAILFDMDGTLLPMDNERFLKIYLSRVGACLPGQDPAKIAKFIMDATVQVMKRDGGEETNAAMFARIFCGITGLGYEETFPYFDRFYVEEFSKIGEYFPPEPLTRAILDLCKKKGFVTALATIPLFPRAAMLARIAWAGMREDDFALCTSYEDFCTTKPNPAYYLDVARRIGVPPEECLMVGNDARDDIRPALAAGMRAFFVTPYAIGEVDDETVPRGGYRELYEYIAALPEVTACS